MNTTFDWERVKQLTEESMGFMCKEYDDYVKFYCPRAPFLTEIPKNEIKEWLDLIQWFEYILTDFDKDKFCLTWLKAKEAGRPDIPHVEELVRDANDIIQNLEDLLSRFRAEITNS